MGIKTTIKMTLKKSPLNPLKKSVWLSLSSNQRLIAIYDNHSTYTLMTTSGPMATPSLTTSLREGPSEKSREVLSRMRALVGCGCKTSFFQSKPFQLAEKVTLVIIELSNFCLLFIHPYLTYHPYMPSPLFDEKKNRRVISTEKHTIVLRSLP